MLCLLVAVVAAQGLPAGGIDVVALDWMETPVGGLERTGAVSERIREAGPAFQEALRVRLPRKGAESNATQLTLLNRTPIQKGDVLLAEFHLRGQALDGGPAEITFMFEKATEPWTKSAVEGVRGHAHPSRWRRAVIAFESNAAYAPGEAMASFRFAGQAQTVLLGGVRILNYRRTRSLESLQALAFSRNPLGTVEARLLRGQPRQTMLGFGGNFCQPRYGRSEAMDPVGETNLRTLNVFHARIGLPLERWAPAPGQYVEDGPPKAALQALGRFAKMGIPTVVSVWEGPAWMLPGSREASGKRLPPERYRECIEAVALFLEVAKHQYGSEPEYFSFNEPDYGVNFKFSPQEMAAFVKQAGVVFAQRGLKTRFVVADTANGTNFADYARPLLEDREIAKYLGPLAFHSWDALTASDAAYRAIAELGRKHRKPVWCLEAGHDAQLWQARDPWASWENALRTALAYERTLRLTEAQLMSYWTYQDNYPLVSQDGKTPYPVQRVMRQMERVFAKGARVAWVETGVSELRALGTTSGAALLVNPVGPGRVRLSGLPVRQAVQITVSTAERQGVATSTRADAQGRLEVGLPARSVVTVRPAG